MNTTSLRYKFRSIADEGSTGNHLVVVDVIKPPNAATFGEEKDRFFGVKPFEKSMHDFQIELSGET